MRAYKCFWPVSPAGKCVRLLWLQVTERAVRKWIKLFNDSNQTVSKSTRNISPRPLIPDPFHGSVQGKEHLFLVFRELSFHVQEIVIRGEVAGYQFGGHV